MVEHNLAKVGVAGPNPVFRSRKFRSPGEGIFFYALMTVSIFIYTRLTSSGLCNFNVVTRLPNRPAEPYFVITGHVVPHFIALLCYSIDVKN